MKFIHINFFIVLLSLIFLGGCQVATQSEPQTKVGLLLPHYIDDQGWNSKGYQGLLKIHSSLNVDVFYKEEIDTQKKVIESIEEFVNDGINLIFGHSQFYAPIFMDIKDRYPDVHFITFNGDVAGENITSLHFKGYAMFFFAGMLATEMSETNKVGVIAAFPWQPEVEGFVEGALFQNENIDVKVEYVSSWVDVEKAKTIYQEMVIKNVDVFYPAGDGFHVPIIKEIKKDGLYVIGYVSDHSDIGQSTVLTSTIQHVDDLYEIVTTKFLDNQLGSGNKYFDFAEGVISLGVFSPEVPENIQQLINGAIDYYILTGKLPNE